MERRARGSHLGLLLLFSQILQVGISNIPPVTLGCMVLNIWLFLNPLMPLYKVCLSVELCYERKDWQRLLFSPFHHADDWHLYFNMVSMLWKGLTLERRLGSAWFAYVIAVFTLLTSIIYLALESILAELLSQPDLKVYCAIGFSGVLFALKVLNNNYNPGGHTYFMGMYIPNRFACWVELVMIHFLSPQTSFAGHLAGIIVGLMYTLGPLKKIMEACAGIFAFNNFHARQEEEVNNAGYFGAYQEDVFDEQPYQEIPRNYDIFTGGMTEEEQLERALRDSLYDRVHVNNSPPPYGFNIPPEDEMRRQRLNRFDRH